MSLTELREKVLQLPLADRASLAHDILATLDSPASSNPIQSQSRLDEAQTRFALRRLAEFEHPANANRRTIGAADSLRDLRNEFKK